jgi:hypothetical protein
VADLRYGRVIVHINKIEDTRLISEHGRVMHVRLGEGKAKPATPDPGRYNDATIADLRRGRVGGKSSNSFLVFRLENTHM